MFAPFGSDSGLHMYNMFAAFVTSMLAWDVFKGTFVVLTALVLVGLILRKAQQIGGR